jgi:hypothetical protein
VEIRDLIITPVVILIVYAVAYIIRPLVTDSINSRYFFPALTVRILGALLVGFVYQFYYHGGDTYNFHTHGSRHVWNAFWESPEAGIKLFFSNGTDETGIYKYSSRIPFFRDRSSFAVIRLASFFDLFTFSSYSATAVCFAVLSFVGNWMLFLTFYQDRMQLHRPIALATLFVPSVFFWGSGLLKDTITLAALGILTFMVKRIFIQKRIRLMGIFVMVVAAYLIYSIKVYILLCYLPAALLWVFFSNLSKINSSVLKGLMLPLVVVVAGVSGYFAIVQVGANDPRYKLDMLGKTAKVTAYDIAFQTGRDAGSTYSLGELDGSFSNLISLAPQAINVSLFRPYLWEINGLLMLFSAAESLVILFLTVFVFIKSLRWLGQSLIKPDALFCLVFSLTFAFSVGVSTFNFGTLSRYKIPLIPFYLLALIIVYYTAKNERKFPEFDSTE